MGFTFPWQAAEHGETTTYMVCSVPHTDKSCGQQYSKGGRWRVLVRVLL